MKSHFQKIFICLVILLSSGKLYPADNSSSNQQDSLALKDIIARVIKDHPSIKMASEALNASDAKIALAKVSYYPEVDIALSYTRLGPVPSIEFPGLGLFQLYPEDNYNTSLNINQVLYNFGKTTSNIDYESENKVLAQQSLDQARQKLSMSVIMNYYALLYLQEALLIKDQQLKTLQEHLEFINKKKETGSATQYEILSTQVKISAIESQKIDLQAAWQMQLSVLNNLMGNPENESHYVKHDLLENPLKLPSDSLIPYAISNRDEMIMSKERTQIAELRYKMVNTQNNPMINLFASGGWKNGFIPDLNVMKANFAAGLGVSVPLFDGTRTKNSLLLASSSIQNSKFETEMTRRNISNEVVENQSNLKASKNKVSEHELQLKHAQEALALAEVSYKAGAIINLDLIDAITSVSESSLMLLKAKIDYTVNIYKLQASLGIRLY
jgi:outer membrane protein TolC